MDQPSIYMTFARFAGIVFPALYTGITVDYSFTWVPTIVNHAPNQKIMAKQWLQGYQTGPLWVPPLIAPGVISNVCLAYAANAHLQRYLYTTAAVAIFSILPITFFYMEPGVNGASKWKAQLLLSDEGMNLPETSIFQPSAHKHGSTKASRIWAEKANMKELILSWQYINNLRWVLSGISVILSGYATLWPVGA